MPCAPVLRRNGCGPESGSPLAGEHEIGEAEEQGCIARQAGESGAGSRGFLGGGAGGGFEPVEGDVGGLAGAGIFAGGLAEGRSPTAIERKAEA